MPADTSLHSSVCRVPKECLSYGVESQWIDPGRRSTALAQPLSTAPCTNSHNDIMLAVPAATNTINFAVNLLLARDETRQARFAHRHLPRFPRRLLLFSLCISFHSSLSVCRFDLYFPYTRLACEGPFRPQSLSSQQHQQDGASTRISASSATQRDTWSRWCSRRARADSCSRQGRSSGARCDSRGHPVRWATQLCAEEGYHRRHQEWRRELCKLDRQRSGNRPAQLLHRG